MSFSLSISIIIGLFFSIFLITLVKEDILLSIYDLIKIIPKYAKIILFLVVVALLIFLIVFEAINLYK